MFYCQKCRMQVGDASHFDRAHPEPPYNDGKTYTLLEAKRELDRQECRHYGHSWDVVETLVQPVSVVCSRCGTSYAVTPVGAEQPLQTPNGE